jgi:2-polyprenyl-3-methyl-5-hydroxy-6-metoxy-1,4-benzoquinol methylase
LNNFFFKNKFYNRYIFSKIYKYDLFNSFVTNKESKSGPGSNFEQTAQISVKIPELIKKYNIKSILDLPCGDFYWMNKVDLADVEYIGGDIVSVLIEYNSAKFTKKNITFKEIDIVNDSLPKVDMVLCRDLFVHLKHDQILIAIKNIKNSGSKYLLTTSYKMTNQNNDIDRIGTWRPLNLEIAPFHLNVIVDEIYENCTEADGRYSDKYLVLYLIDKL